MAKMIIPVEDHVRISSAVAEAELKSDGEISTMVARQSDNYSDWILFIAALVPMLTLATIMLIPERFEQWVVWLMGNWHPALTRGELLFAVLVVQALSFVKGWALLRGTPLGIWLTPKAIKIRRVRREAVRAFRIGIESRTRAATGVLIYLSLAEHRAELVADAAINGKVNDADWGEAMARLIGDVRDGRPGDGIAGAVEMVGALLATHFPRSQDDQNEMPDRLIEL
jgi:putative membrane protein